MNAALLNRLFDLRARRTDIRTEILADAVTFLTMVFIIAVNPAILSDAVLPREATVAATCLAAAIPTIAMRLWANWPLALAPGMGLSAFLTYSLVKGHASSGAGGDGRACDSRSIKAPYSFAMSVLR